MPLFLTLFSLLITAAVAASAGWLAGYCLAIRLHQACLAKLIGKTKPSRIPPPANDSAAGNNSISAMQGAYLYEFAELGSVARAEATKLKSLLSRQVVTLPAKPLG